MTKCYSVEGAAVYRIHALYVSQLSIQIHIFTPKIMTCILCGALTQENPKGLQKLEATASSHPLLWCPSRVIQLSPGAKLGEAWSGPSLGGCGVWGRSDGFISSRTNRGSQLHRPTGPPKVQGPEQLPRFALAKGGLWAWCSFKLHPRGHCSQLTVHIFMILPLVSYEL